MDAGASETTGSSSTSLIRRAQQEDPSAWERVAELYGPLVYGWARQAGLQASDAADVGQEVLRAVLLRVNDFRRDRASGGFRGWLWGITRNKLREFARRRAAGPQAAGGSTANARLHRLSQLPEDESAEFRQAEGPTSLIHRALDVISVEFEQRTWQAFWLTTVESRPSVDVAEQLDMTSGAVRQAKYKVLRRLRQELGDAE